MVVVNQHRETAVVIRRNGKKVVLVTMRGGSLSASKVSEQVFRSEWQEIAYSLAHALETFLSHAEHHGATQEAMKGLRALHERDRYMVGSLF